MIKQEFNIYQKNNKKYQDISKTAEKFSCR